jgi:acyl-CoA reductase-like NAD-dependent aldehyde dehydrogenase
MIGASVERIYVERSVYAEFIRHFVEIAKKFTLGDPLSKETSLGPVVSLASAARIRQQVDDAGKSIFPFPPPSYNAYLRSCCWS